MYIYMAGMLWELLEIILFYVIFFLKYGLCDAAIFFLQLI